MKYHSLFSQSLFEAIDHYYAIDRKLARRFVAAIDEAKEEILRFPKIGRALRRCRIVHLRDFPFRLCYRENFEGELVIVALVHHKQRGPKFD
jgi:hypothetical protein